ncbi:MAG: DUF2927 domain-containing protein [Pseudomonadota bacterium]
MITKARALLLAAAFALSACATSETGWTGARPSASPIEFGLRPQGGTAYDNGDLAALFLRLAFEMETGQSLASSNRLEAPVLLVPDPAFGDALDSFLDGFSNWMILHAGLEMRRAPAGQPGAPHAPDAAGAAGAAAVAAKNAGAGGQVVGKAAGSIIALRPVAAAWRDRAAADFACFVLYGPPIDPAELRGRAAIDAHFDRWTDSGIVTVYLPTDLEGEQLASCLYEEILQGLGVANDIPDLLESIFNDDEIHHQPTALDMLMVRTLYAIGPEAARDPDRAYVEARRALEVLNPAGNAPDAQRLTLVTRDEALAYTRAVGLAMMRDGSGRRQLSPGETAEIVRAIAGKPAALRCSGLFLHAQVLRRDERPEARRVLETAADACTEAAPEDTLRAALIDAERAILLVREQRRREALDAIQGVPSVLARHGQAELATEIAAVGIVLDSIDDVPGGGGG